MSGNVLEISDLRVEFSLHGQGALRAVDGRVVSRAARKDGGARGRVGIGQVGDLPVGAGDPAGRGADQRRRDPIPGRPRGAAGRRHRGARSRQRRHAGDPRRPDLDDLPGADDLALAPAHGRGPDWRGGAAAPRRDPRRGARPRRRDARDGGVSAPGEGARQLPVRALRGVAPARDDRDGAGMPSGAADRGRADHRARRDHPGPDPEADPRPPVRAPHGGAAHHPRPRGGGEHGRRGGGGLPRAAHGTRRARATSTRTRAIRTSRRSCARCRGSASTAASA